MSEPLTDPLGKFRYFLLSLFMRGIGRAFCHPDLDLTESGRDLDARGVNAARA